MLVKTIEHGLKVFADLERQWAKNGRSYFAFDTETQAKKGLHKDEALTFDRMETLIFSICYQGQSYSFPTANLKVGYPLVCEWADLLRPYFEDSSVMVAAHNWGYDAMVCISDFKLELPLSIWDTMIACWKASEWMPKGLKDRAPAYGRFLQKTANVDFTNETALSFYAEEDVVQTDELFQTQLLGHVVRRKSVQVVAAKGKPETVSTSLPAHTKLVVERDVLTEFDEKWLSLLELPVLRATIRAQRRGFPFNSSRLKEARLLLGREMRASLRRVYSIAGRIINPGSSKQLAEVFKELQIDNPATTPKGAMSFDVETLKSLQHVHPFVTAVLAYKSNEKMQSVYVGTTTAEKGTFNPDSGLDYYVNPRTDSIHCSIHTVGAITGRASSSNPNLQQVPSKKDRFGIKRCFTAKDNSRRLLVLDYAQLEIRVMALYCKDPKMTEILVDPDGDIHTMTAQLFGVSRDVAKQLNFLLLYGGGSYMLSSKLTEEGVPTTTSQAQAYIDTQRIVYPLIAQFREALVAFHKANGYVPYFTGRRRVMADADWSSKRGVHKVETTLSNNVVQGAGQDMLKAAIVRCDHLLPNPDKAMLRLNPPMSKEHRLYLQDRVVDLTKIRALFRKAKLQYHLQVHDEVVMSCEREAAQETIAMIAEVMSWRHYFPSISNYNVPLVAEGGVAENWQAAKSKKEFEFHIKAGYEHFNKYAN